MIMLVLVGILRAATTLPGGTNKKTNEAIKPRDVLQIETLDGRGLVAMNTITVPSLEKFAGLIGKEIKLPVRAWAANTTVNYMYENPVQAA
jgi:hypothetical protein